MAKRVILLIALASIFFLQSCTIAYYKVREGIENKPSSEHRTACNVEYSMNLNAQPRQFTRTPNYDQERLRKDLEEYVQATEETFKEKGCLSHYVENGENSNFKIYVLKQPIRSALPQEWLTGLSFGLIPSWGTRPSEFIYIFENTKIGNKREYVIDNVSYNHLVLFPFTWITFLTLDEIKIYKKSLSNFIENS